MFSLSFLIFRGQNFVEVPQLLKSVSSFMYRIVNRILRFVSRYVSNRGIVYRYTPNERASLVLSVSLHDDLTTRMRICERKISAFFSDNFFLAFFSDNFSTWVDLFEDLTFVANFGMK